MPQPIYDIPGDKLWAHRVNTAQNALGLLREFSGLEIDVFYIEDLGEFQTGHDSPSGISLDDYIDSIADPGQFYYWLDFKNLNSSNAGQAVCKLQSLIETFRLHKHIIVESSDASGLAYFKKAGIFTSYWVSDISGVSFPYFRERKLHDEVYDALSNYHFDVLSATYKMCPFLFKYFRGYNIHVWTNGLSGKSDEVVIADLARNFELKVILVDYDRNFLFKRRDFMGGNKIVLK